MQIAGPDGGRQWFDFLRMTLLGTKGGCFVFREFECSRSTVTPIPAMCYPLAEQPTARREACWRSHMSLPAGLGGIPVLFGGFSVMGAWPAESSEK